MSFSSYPIVAIKEGERAFHAGIKIEPPYGGQYLLAWHFGYGRAQAKTIQCWSFEPTGLEDEFEKLEKELTGS